MEYKKVPEDDDTCDGCCFYRVHGNCKHPDLDGLEFGEALDCRDEPIIYKLTPTLNAEANPTLPEQSNG